MIGKRGISGIITSVLMVLLVIAAIAILWVVTARFIENSAQALAMGKNTISLNIADNSLKCENGSIEFDVIRNSGRGNLSRIMFVLQDNNKNTEAHKVDSKIDELEKQKITIFTNITGFAEIDTTPIIVLQQSEIIGTLKTKYNVNEYNSVNCFNINSGNQANNGSQNNTICANCLPSQICFNNACCSPATCASLSKQCGSWSDICGGTLSCGTCGYGNKCSSDGLCIAMTLYSTGWKNASIVSQYAGTGTVNWITPNNINSSNGQYAVFGPSANKESSYILNLSDFNVNLPGTAIITGIQIVIQRNLSYAGATPPNDFNVTLFNGSATSTNKAISGNWSATLVNATYGNSTDLWGINWSAGGINSTNFGLFYQVKENDKSLQATVYVDYIAINISYLA